MSGKETFVLCSLLVSLAAHLVLVAILMKYPRTISMDDNSPELVVCEVKLSLAEKDDVKSEPSIATESVGETGNVPETSEPYSGIESKVEPPGLLENVLPSPAESPEQMITAPRQARIDALPEAKTSIRPYYPLSARRRGNQGSVGLEVMISDDGEAMAVEVIESSGYTELDDAAIEAVKAAKFSPAKSDGCPVTAKVSITLEFKLK